MNKLFLFVLKIRRQIVYPIVLMLLFSILLGCAAGPPVVTETPVIEVTDTPEPLPTATRTPEFTPTPDTPAYLEIDPESLAGIQVEFVHPWLGETADVLDEIASEFNQDNPWGIQVNVAGYGGDWALTDALQASLDNGHLPGLIAARPYQVSTLEGDFAVVSLSRYLNSPEWGLDESAMADIPAVFLDQFTVGENLVALPLAPQATVLFYNQTWASELGFATRPVDAQGFRAQSCTATIANQQSSIVDERGTGGLFLDMQPNVLAGWFNAFGGDLPVGRSPVFNTTAGQEAFGFIKSLVDEGCVWGLWGAREPFPNRYFSGRLALLYPGTLDQIPAHLRLLEVAASEDQLAVMGFVGTAGEVVIVDGPGLMISEDTAEKQMAAWLFARHLITPAVQAKLVQTHFSIPVRNSAMEDLGELIEDYPQWLEGVSLLNGAYPLPISEGWGIGQWVLQDGVYRLLVTDKDEMPEILEQLDQTIQDLEGIAP